MEDKKDGFPSIKKSIEDFLDDEDGNITRSKLATIGAIIMVMSIMFAVEAGATHSSHSSHESHSSHSSSSHSSHGSHDSHDSHSSHVSHTSHSNTTSHSNSLYSEEGDVSYGPSASQVTTVSGVPNSSGSVPVISASSVTGSGASQQVLPVAEDGTVSTLNFQAAPSAQSIPATIPPQEFAAPNLDVPYDAESAEFLPSSEK